MNNSWDTPPGGDFAAYVEQLTARSARSMLAPVPQQSSDFEQDDEHNRQPATGGLGTEFGRTLSPGQALSQNPLTSGLTAALGTLRESLERSARAAQQRKKS